MSIKIQEVSKFYGSQKALNQVNLDIPKGEIVGFLGPNGAGKSTMMKIITGYLPQTSGIVEVNGLDVLQHSLEVRRQIGYLPEHNPLYLEMYVKEYLEYVAGIYKLGKQKKSRIKEMVELTGLGDEQNKMIGALSKGYRQRVGLAQALIHDPSVLILDEPTTGLDPNQLVDVRRLIKEIGQDKTVMLSTHIMQEVEAICERVVIINKGEVVADGRDSLSLLKQKGTHQQVEVQFNSNVSSELLGQASFISSIEALEGNRFLLSAAENDDIRPRIFQFAVENQLVLLEMKARQKNLEHIFRELTGN